MDSCIRVDLELAQSLGSHHWTASFEIGRPLTREEVYHLAASGVFKAIKLHNFKDNQFDYIDGAALARLVAAVDKEGFEKLLYTLGQAVRS